MRIRRLAVFAAICFWLVGLAVLTPSAAFAQTPPDPAYELEMNVEDGFSLAAVGDLILAYPSSQRRDEPFRSVIGLLSTADVAFGNFELASAQVPLQLRR